MLYFIVSFEFATKNLKLHGALVYRSQLILLYRNYLQPPRRLSALELVAIAVRLGVPVKRIGGGYSV